MIFRQNLDTTNRLLSDPATTAMGAYSIGVISCLAEQEGVVAPDVLLEAAAECQTIAAAVDLYKQCAELRLRRRYTST